VIPGGYRPVPEEEDEYQPGYYRGKPGVPDVILQAVPRSAVRTAESRELFRVTGRDVHNPLSWHRIVRLDGRLYLIAQPTVVAPSDPGPYRRPPYGPGDDGDHRFVETELHPADVIRVNGADYCVVSWPLHDPVLEQLPFYGDLVQFADRGHMVEGRVVRVTPGERGATASIEEEGTPGPHVRLVGAITLIACDVMRISFASRLPRGA
jgi:hypothetical protein